MFQGLILNLTMGYYMSKLAEEKLKDENYHL